MEGLSHVASSSFHFSSLAIVVSCKWVLNRRKRYLRRGREECLDGKYSTYGTCLDCRGRLWCRGQWEYLAENQDDDIKERDGVVIIEP